LRHLLRSASEGVPRSIRIAKPWSGRSRDAIVATVASIPLVVIATRPTACWWSAAGPPASNDAERDLRPAKTQQKISGRLRSEQTTTDRYRIRGYTSTATKHRVDVVTAIRDALLGRPWTPPTPAPT
jgi:hypothetical protein